MNLFHNVLDELLFCYIWKKDFDAGQVIQLDGIEKLWKEKNTCQRKNGMQWNEYAMGPSSDGESRKDTRIGPVAGLASLWHGANYHLVNTGKYCLAKNRFKSVFCSFQTNMVILEKKQTYSQVQ